MTRGGWEPLSWRFGISGGMSQSSCGLQCCPRSAPCPPCVGWRPSLPEADPWSEARGDCTCRTEPSVLICSKNQSVTTACQGFLALSGLCFPGPIAGFGGGTLWLDDVDGKPSVPVHRRSEALRRFDIGWEPSERCHVCLEGDLQACRSSRLASEGHPCSEVSVPSQGTSSQG